MASGSSEELSQRARRITDIVEESHEMFTPVVGYVDTSDMSLENTVVSLLPILPNVQKYASVAKKQCKKPPADGLTIDQSASIRLYSMSWKPDDQCLYIALNATLRSGDRNKLKPWFPYLKLFLGALEQLPPKQRTVYRGVKLNLHEKYPKGKIFDWWAFSSCTMSIGVLKEDLFLGKKGARTMFTIDCFSGKDVRKHSCLPLEDEVLLPAATRFKVIDSLDHGNGLHMIQLEEIKPLEPLLQLLFTPSTSNSTSGIAKQVDDTSDSNKKHQNLVLIWLDSSIDQSSSECNDTITKLRCIINTINTFTDSDQCIQFLKSINDKKVLIIMSGAFGQQVVPTIHDMSQIEAIFIFCGNKPRHEEWSKNWSKIKGVATKIKDICKHLEQAVKQSEEEAITMSFFPETGTVSNQNVDQPDPNYIYTQIFKEILLSIDFKQHHFKDFIDFCRVKFADNEQEIKNIRQFERNYHDHSPIWWYTYDSFLYRMLNRALRMVDIDIIIKMGFFICDLHRQIEQLHLEQCGDHNSSIPFIVYRGQGLCMHDFDQLRKKKGGLVSFNNFLSTNKVQSVSLEFAQPASENPDSYGVVFRMFIDPHKSSIPFASVGSVSYFPDEGEVLFSMNTVFHITDIKPIDTSDRLYQVDLTLTTGDDQELHTLADCIRKEIDGSTEWHRLGQYLLKLGQFNEAEQIYNTLLKQSTNDRDKSVLYNQLGLVKNSQGKYTEAITFYEKSFAIRQKSLSPNHPDLAQSYDNIGVVYQKTGEYSKAVSYHEKAFKIRQTSLPSNHPDLAQSHNNMGVVYQNMGEHSKALSYHEKALKIREMSLPSSHPDLGETYNNIGLVHRKIGQYSKALSFCQRAVECGQRSLPANHPNLQIWQKTLESVKKNCK